MCDIWESCRNSATDKCIHYQENPFAVEPLSNNYEFNNWEDEDEY